ncbi:MAG TPA: transporter substrate-binding domain-containing protein [Spirochaetales bacterium]|nr:transporter substrate-binding domain-containing protein [Spirochaetales bacterium]HOV37386.1 transporter substrate-binding domain-containing protein [Spirochaetales bacterium]
MYVRFLLLFSICAAELCGQVTPPDSFPKEVTVVIDDNYPPFSFRSLEGTLQGLSIDLWTLWSKQTGISVRLVGLDWKEALRRMREGEFDVIDTAFRTPDREQYLEYSRAYWDIEVPIFFHKDLSGIATVQDLKGFVVGVKGGDAVIQYLNDNGIFTLQEFTNYESIILAAKFGTIRVFSIDKPPALYFLNKYRLTDFFRNTDPLYVGSFHRAVQKGNTRLLSILEKGFDQIPPDTYQAVERKWFGQPLVSRQFLHILRIGIGVGILIVILLFLWIGSLRKAVKSRTRDLAWEKDYFSAVFNAVGEGILILSPEGTILDCNESFQRMFEYPIAEALFNYTPSCTETQAREIIKRTLEEGQHRIDWQVRHKNGTIIPVEIVLRLFQIRGEQRIIATVRDITDRVHSIENLSLSLQEKEALLRELGHRTKNNLQLVSSLVSLYLGSCEDPKVRSIAMELQNRIASIAMAHQMLYKGPQLGNVELKQYLEDLTTLLKEGFHPEIRNIDLVLEAEAIQVSPDIALASGLVVNELVTNALKHAFPTRAGGTVRISLSRGENGRIVLQVSDNGVGFPEGFNPRTAETVGLVSLYGIVEQQLRGTLTYTSEHGTVALIEFPL